MKRTQEEVVEPRMDAGEKAKLQALEKEFGEAAQARAGYEGTWYLNLAFFAGDQWLTWDGNRLYKPKLRAGRILITDNRIQPAIRTEVAKLTKQQPAWDATPNSTDENAVDGARRAERVMESKWDEMSMQAKLDRALEWARVCGAGFWKVTWDSSLGKGREVIVGPDGKVVRGPDQSPLPVEMFDQLPPEMVQGMRKQRINQGDVRVDVRSPFQFYPDPLAEALDECERCWEESILSPTYIKARYGVDLRPDSEFTSGLVEARMSRPGGMSSTTQTTKKGVRVREYWEKPSAANPKGRHVVWAKDKILADEPNVYECLPYGMFSGVKVPGRFWPTSIAEQLRPVQVELNKIKSQIAENRNRVGNPSVLISRQANVKMQGLPGEEIKFDDTTQNAIPQYLQPPEMPAYVQNEIEAIQQAIQEISGQHEVSSGTVPSGVTAAAAINLLQEGDDTRLGPAVHDMESAVSHCGTMVLRLVATYYTDERLVKMAGEDEAFDALRFKGAMLNGQDTIRVTPGSMAPRSKAAKQALMQDMFNLMIQYGIRFEQRALRKFFRQWEVGGLESLLGDLDRDEAQVNRENRRMYDSAQPAVGNPLVDNHEAHLAGHREEMKTARFEEAVRSNPQIKQAFEGHLIWHLQQATALTPPPPPEEAGGAGPAAPAAPTNGMSGGAVTVNAPSQ